MSIDDIRPSRRLKRSTPPVDRVPERRGRGRPPKGSKPQPPATFSRGPVPLGLFEAYATANPDAGDKPRKPQPPPNPADFDRDSVFHGVSATWCAHAFKMSITTAKAKLAGLVPIRYDGHRRAVYDFNEAAGRLVPPTLDLHTFLNNMDPKDMPQKLQKGFWDAKIAQQKYELRAGRLWDTDQVLDAIGDLLKTIRTTTQLWVDNLDRREKLTPKQFDMIQQSVDALLSELHDAIVDMSDKHSVGTLLSAEEADDAD